MRLQFVKILSVESLVEFVVFFLCKLIYKYQVVRRCFVENRATDISLASPHATHDTIDVVNLQEAVHFQVG